MSTLTADPPTTSHAATPPAAAQVQPTFAGVVRGEWIKLLSLRSTWWALASTAAVITLVALATAASLNAIAPPWPRASSRCTAPRSSPAASTSGC
jgi:ABC-2 type transport system permease protein